jgi:hypothetical protein
MHILEGVFRPKNGDIERTLEWWKGLMLSSEAFDKNGTALNRMDGENSVLIVRRMFDNLAGEGKAWDMWAGSDTGNRPRRVGRLHRRPAHISPLQRPPFLLRGFLHVAPYTTLAIVDATFT